MIILTNDNCGHCSRKNAVTAYFRHKGGQSVGVSLCLKCITKAAKALATAERQEAAS